METKDSAVQLLKEWKAAKNAHSDAAFLLQVGIGKPDESSDSLLGVIDGISHRLDEKAEAAGIHLHVDGMVSFSKFGDKTDEMVCPRIYAKELHAILEWLLIKNEEKTA